MKQKKTKHNDNDHNNTNVVNKVTLEILNDKHNALACYLGIPCVIEPSEIFNGAAKADGSIAHSKEYMCYRVDMKPFKGHFKKIRFRAASNGADIVFGFIKDKNGKVECVAGSDTADSGNIVLPLTKESGTLIATMPAKNGRPLWKNITAELLCDGVISKVNDALNYLLDKLLELESKVSEETTFKQAVINLSIV